LDLKKTKALMNIIADTYNLRPRDVQYILEKKLTDAYSSKIPAAILMNGTLLVYSDKIGFKAVLPGAKILEKALVKVEDELREHAIKYVQNNLFNKEPIGFGKIISRLPDNRYEVMLFDGLEYGKPINIKIAKGIFSPKNDGINGETYTIGNHYLFKKKKIVGNTILLSRNDTSVIKQQVDLIVLKLNKRFKKDYFFKVKQVDMRGKEIHIICNSNSSHLIKPIRAKIFEKTKFMIRH